MKIFKFIIKQTLILFTLFLAIIIVCNWYIEYYSDQYIFDSIEKVPQNKVGLLLGTSKWVRKGKINLYFKNRIEAAVQLYKHNKIQYIIVSGDNRTEYYNEPRTMMLELIKYGIPGNRIYLDYVGLRTIDSVTRARDIFDLKKYTIISQKFHNQRAVFIARKIDTEAIGFNARAVNTEQKGKKVKLREIMARVKVFIDLYLSKKQNKFIGKKIKIR